MKAIVGLLILSAVNIAHAQSADFSAANDALKNCLSSSGSTELSSFNEWLSLNTQMTAGRVEPKTWQDFVKIDELREKMKSALGSDSVKAAFAGCGEAGRNRALLIPRELESIPPRLTEFSVIGRGMIASYVEKVQKVNALLPVELRAVTDTVLPDAKKEKLLADGFETVARIEKDYADELYATSGFSNHEDLMKGTKKVWPEAMPFVERIIADDIDFAIARPENGRFWMPKTGFQNQFVTGSSKGSYNPVHRLNVETRLGRFKDLASYEPLDKDFKPKYGYVFDRQNPQTSGYGDDMYLLKKDRVGKRATYTVDDSFIFYGSSYGNYDKNWMGSFTPWKYRDLGAIQMARRYALVPPPKRPESPSGSVSYYYDSSGYFDFDGAGWKAAYKDRRPSYVELQFWGPVTLDDVDSFVFMTTPPSGEFLEELNKRKIKIFKMQRNTAPDACSPYEGCRRSSPADPSTPMTWSSAYELKEWKEEAK